MGLMSDVAEYCCRLISLEGTELEKRTVNELSLDMLHSFPLL